MGIENGGLGYCGDELTGMLIAGNDFNYVMSHAKAIDSAKKYNIVSCSSEAVETGKVNLTDYDAVDLLLGLERNDGHSVNIYKTFSTLMQNALQRYTAHGGALLVSGAYIGTDMTLDTDRRFLQTVMKTSWGGRSQVAELPRLPISCNPSSPPLLLCSMLTAMVQLLPIAATTVCLSWDSPSSAFKGNRSKLASCEEY